jgi:ATP-binding cassette subfamily B protein
MVDRFLNLRKKPTAATTTAGALAAAPPLSQEEEEEAKYRPIDLALGRRMVGLLAPYKWQYALGLALGLAMNALELQSPKFMEAMVNHVTAYVGDAGTGPAATNSSYVGRFIDWVVSAIRHESPIASPRGATVTIVVTVAFWAVVLACALVLQRYTILVMTGAGERVQFGIRKRLFAHLQRLSMSYYDKTKLGRIISRCTSDVSSMREINVWGLYTILANLQMMLFAAVMLATTDWRLFAAVAPLGVLLFVVNRLYLKKSAALNQVAREGWTRVSTNLAENITGMRVVAAFHRQEPNLGRFNRLQEQNTENNVRVARLNGVFQPLLQAIGFSGQAIILTYGAYLVVTGRLDVGAVVACFLYWSIYFINPIQNFAQFYNQLLMAMAGAERVFHLLDMSPDVQDVAGAQPLPRITGRVQFEHVTFGYDPSRPVLHDINFEAQPGQTVALVGATGSGKSSIISLIARFYQPQQGQVLVDGNDIRNVTGESLHRQMGLVLQVNYLFTGTVMENIRYAIASATDEDVINAAKAIGSYDAILSLKDGFATEVGERGANMSLGQRQLICFTRAFLADPRIFMLDEATSAVDTATEQLVQSSLEKLLAGRTTFIVAHRLSTIMRADVILVIDAGRIVERGTHRQLLAAGGRYAHLYEQFVTHAA